MKIEEAGIETFSFGQKEVSVARIQASAKAFEILSSSLYSNSVLAIIRELCANAKDSHTAAGKPTAPFQVQCPNDLDPQFKVRDFGVGMNHEFVMTRLNTYFDSTKNGSNEEIGGFGLGIKSVFSYTTSFTIACYDGQSRRVYTYQIGSTGLPEISFLAETASKEPNGVEVCVPVKREDYKEFQSNAVEALTFYNPRPTITGMDNSNFDIELIYSGTNWAIYQNPRKLAAESYVEMGDVIYPINDNDSNGYGRRHSNDVVIVYKAGIGDIDITPNREQIKLTDKSKEQIKKFEAVMRDELFGQIQTYIKSFTCSYWDILRDSKVRDLINSDIFRKFGIDQRKLKYRGYPVDGNYEVNYSRKTMKAGLEKLLNVYTAQPNYGELRVHPLNLDHYGIVVSLRRQSGYVIIVGDKKFRKDVSKEKLDHKFGENTNAYLIECDDNDADAIVADINRVIPDYSEKVIKWNDIKADLDHIKVQELMIHHKIEKGYYNHNETPIEFTIAAFTGKKTVYYELQNGESGYGGHYRCQSSLHNMLHYLSEEVVTMIHKIGIKEAYSLSETQVAELKAAGFKVIKFTIAVDKVLKEIATEFANSRPTMSLKQYLKPLTDKNPRICLSTHYKAVKRWARESGDPELHKLMLELSDESSSSYRRTTEDHLFRAITKKGVKEYITDKKIVATKVTDNQVIQDLATKAPLCARLVSDYNDREVIDYVRSAMGWPGATAVVSTKAKRPQKRVVKAAPTIVQTVDPNAVLKMISGV